MKRPEVVKDKAVAIAIRMMDGELFFGKNLYMKNSDQEYSLRTMLPDYVDFQKALHDHNYYQRACFEGCLHEAFWYLIGEFEDTEDFWEELIDDGFRRWKASEKAKGQAEGIHT